MMMLLLLLLILAPVSEFELSLVLLALLCAFLFLAFLCQLAIRACKIQSLASFQRLGAIQRGLVQHLRRRQWGTVRVHEERRIDVRCNGVRFDDARGSLDARLGGRGRHVVRLLRLRVVSEVARLRLLLLPVMILLLLMRLLLLPLTLCAQEMRRRSHLRSADVSLRFECLMLQRAVRQSLLLLLSRAAAILFQSIPGSNQSALRRREQRCDESAIIELTARRSLRRSERRLKPPSGGECDKQLCELRRRE